MSHESMRFRTPARKRKRSASSSDEETRSPVAPMPLAGLAAVAPAVSEDAMEVDDAVVLDDEGTTKPPRKRLRPVAPEDALTVTQGVLGALGGKGFAPGAVKQAGQRPMDEADTIARKGRSYEDDRVTQLLIHVSDVLLTMLKQKKVEGVVEAQSMFVNDRVLISENTKKGRLALERALRKKTLAVIADTVRDTIRNDTAQLARFKKSKRKVDPIVLYNAAPQSAWLPRRHANKLVNTLDSGRHWEEPEDPDDVSVDTATALRLIEVLKGKTTGKNGVLRRVDAGESGLITSDRYEGKILIVDGPSGFHAEQNLMWAYKQSGSTPQATIAGVKRPCLGCYLTFRLMTEQYGADIDFNAHSGFAWAQSIKNVKKFLEDGYEGPSVGSGLSDEVEDDVAAASTFLYDSIPTTAFISRIKIQRWSKTGRALKPKIVDDSGHASESESEDEDPAFQ